jgi:hypothetical protein
VERIVGRSPHVVAAAAILGILGAVWAAVGAVLVIVAWLYGNPASLPDWLAADPLVSGSAPALAPTGILAVAVGLGQVAAGVATARGSDRWALVLGLVLSAIGAGVAAVWLYGGMSQGRPAQILLPVLAAYLYAAWAIAFRADR